MWLAGLRLLVGVPLIAWYLYLAPDVWSVDCPPICCMIGMKFRSPAACVLLCQCVSVVVVRYIPCSRQAGDPQVASGYSLAQLLVPELLPSSSPEFNMATVSRKHRDMTIRPGEVVGVQRKTTTNNPLTCVHVSRPSNSSAWPNPARVLLQEPRLHAWPNRQEQAQLLPRKHACR